MNKESCRNTAGYIANLRESFGYKFYGKIDRGHQIAIDALRNAKYV